MFVSASCEGERCFCGEAAKHKVEETIFHDDPVPQRHPFTAYVCDEHFRQIMDEETMKLVRVVAPHFVAGFEIEYREGELGGIVRRAAPILKGLIGKSDDYARETIKRYGWKASIITTENNFQKTS